MTPPSRARAGGLVPLALAAAVVVTACNVSVPVDKQGAPVPATTELTLGAADPVDPQLTFFVDAVDQLSGHRLRVRLDTKTWNTETPGGEARLAADVRSGTVPLGYVPSRDLATDGASAFQALHTPFLVTSTPDTVTLAGSPLAAQILADLDDRGLHGLALVPLEVRRLLSQQPILGLADLKGRRVRINDNAQTERLASALSLIPVQGYLAATTHAELAAGRLDAVESSPLYITANAYYATAPYLTSFGLFPKFDVLVVNPATWAALPEADRQILRSAATETLANAATGTPAGEAKGLAQLCARGVVVVRPPDAALDELTAAAAAAAPTQPAVTGWVARVRDALAVTSAALASAPGSSPVPPECPIATTAADAVRLHRATASPSAAPSAGPSARATAAASRFPIGTYTTFVTRADWKAEDVTTSIGTADITFTTTFGADGTLTQSQQPDFPDQGTMVGTYEVSGDRLTITYHSVLDPTTVNVETVRWSYLRGELRFVVVEVLDSASRTIYKQPWRRTA